MTPDALRWVVVDLVRLFDAAHDGRYHGELSRLAETLGVEIPLVAAPPDPAPCCEADGEVPGNEQETEQDRVYQFLAAQTAPVGLARIIGELGLKKWTVTSILYRLQRKGRIEHAGYDAWRVRGAE